MFATALTLLLAASFNAAAASGTADAWSDQYVIANGIRIHYWRSNTPGKPVLIMAHGSSDDGMCWMSLAKEFVSSYDIILYDARGHGRTDPPSAWDAADVQVEDMAGLIRELKIQKPIIMGHSMGSGSAAWFAAKYPDIPRAVILEDPGLVPNPNMNPATMLAERDQRRAAILARNNMTKQQLVADCMKNSPKWGQAECELWAPSKQMHHPNTALGTIGSRPPMKDILPKITAPTLILKADAQGELRKKNEEVAALLPKGKIVHIAGAGHNVRRENRQQTIDVMRDFLAGI
jgi:pimeloyl-ACP methyl ester carboxylesterase